MENLSAKNLRIGNWVQDEHGIVQYVYRLWKGGAELAEGEDGGDDLDYSEEEIFGIPINEEWLINFGFQNYHTWEYRWGTGGLQIIETNGYWYPAVFSHPEMSHEDDQCVSLNRIKHIHELQNLFFAITGEELELKTVV